LFTPLRPQERQDGVLRGGIEPAQGEFVPRTLRAAVVFGVEGVVNELAQKIGMDHSTCASRMPRRRGIRRSTAKPSVRSAFWKRLIGRQELRSLQIARCRQGQGRGVATGFWFNRGGETTGTPQHRR